MDGLQGALQGKRVLIIGGVGSGIGHGITQKVGAAGASAVAVVGRNLDRAKEAANEIASGTCKAFALTADVCEAEDVKKIIPAAVEKLGGLDVLITVVGGYGLYRPWEPLIETSDEAWDLIFDVNLRYVFRLVRDAVKFFLEQKTGGTIVSVGSIAGVMGTPMAVAYGASKAGLMSLAKTVTAEYGRRGIRMNVMNCGPVMAPALESGVQQGMKFEPVPLGRAAIPEEAANVTVFLASPLSSYVAGQTLNLDGGITARCLLRLGKTDSSMACHCETPSDIEVSVPVQQQ